MNVEKDLGRILLFMFERLAMEEKPCMGVTGVTSFMLEILQIAQNNGWELTTEEITMIQRSGKAYVDLCVILQDRAFLQEKVESV